MNKLMDETDPKNRSLKVLPKKKPKPRFDHPDNDLKDSFILGR